jgi:putative multicomponent Na+:H+ antiporter subunit B
MNDIYIYFIIALLPLSACMLLLQTNPYNALVTRGILGAVAALVYVVLGAADVALTEALVGTMLAITLYAVAVRSSLIMRLGILKDGESNFAQLKEQFQKIIGKYHMRLELVPYSDKETLHQALMNKEIHATCIPESSPQAEYHTATRVRRLYEIMESELSASGTVLTYISPVTEGEKHS